MVSYMITGVRCCCFSPMCSEWHNLGVYYSFDVALLVAALIAWIVFRRTKIEGAEVDIAESMKKVTNFVIEKKSIHRRRMPWIVKQPCRGSGSIKHHIMKTTCIPPAAPAAISPQPGCEDRKSSFLLGSASHRPRHRRYARADIKAQTRQSLSNVKAILEAAGTSMENVVKSTVFLADMSLFGPMNEVYAEFFCEPFPHAAHSP